MGEFGVKGSVWAVTCACWLLGSDRGVQVMGDIPSGAEGCEKVVLSSQMLWEANTILKEKAYLKENQAPLHPLVLRTEAIGNLLNQERSLCYSGISQNASNGNRQNAPMALHLMLPRTRSLTKC